MFNASNRDGSPRGPLPKMSDRPTLLEFFEKRFAPANHVLQSATRALKTGMPEEVIFACLMHDTVHALVKVDHGWWGAQIIEPYVSEKVRLRHPPSPDAALLSGREVRLRVSRELPAHVRRGLQAGAVPRAELQDGAQPQVVRPAAAGHGQRPLLVRSERQGVDRSVRRHHRPAVQAAEGRASATTTVRPRTCGGRSCSRIGRCRRRLQMARLQLSVLWPCVTLCAVGDGGRRGHRARRRRRPTRDSRSPWPASSARPTSA